MNISIKRTPEQEAAMAYAIERSRKRSDDEAMIHNMGKLVQKFNTAVIAYVASNPQLSQLLHKPEFVTGADKAIMKSAGDVANRQNEISLSYEHAIQEAIKNDASVDSIETLRDDQHSVCAHLAYMPAELNIAQAARLIPPQILSGIFYQADSKAYKHSIEMRVAGFSHTADVLAYQVALIADGIHPVPSPK